MKDNRLEHLDGIRGLAAFSGFVIARSYFDRLAEGMTVTKFMMRRFARLYPLHLLTLLSALAYELVKWQVFDLASIGAKHVPFENNNLFSFVCTALLVHALGVLPASYWNGPSWSISAEFYVYLVFAVCVALSRHRRSLFWTLLIGLQVLSLAILAIFPGGRSVE